MARVYRPKAMLRLTVPLFKDNDYEPFTFDMPVLGMTLDLNNHRQADILNVDVSWIDAGVDPRLLSSASCQLFLANVDSDDVWDPDDAEMRFCGRLHRTKEKLSDEAMTVSMEFVDYTSFFTLASPFASAGVPTFSDTITSAWRRLCQHTPGAEGLAESIELRLTSDVRLGSSVAQRFRREGRGPVKDNDNAWVIWSQAMGMLGMVTWIDLDKCVVCPMTGYFTAVNQPKFLWGVNIVDMGLERDTTKSNRPILISSYDPLTHQVVEATYDPFEGNKVKQKKATAHSRRKKPTVKVVNDYDVFTYPGVTDQAKLEELAEAVWQMRSRQEVSGHVETSDMEVPLDDNGKTFDLLTIRSGDCIDLRDIWSDDITFIRSFDSVDDRVAYLQSKGYTAAVAQVVATNIDLLSKQSTLYYVKSAQIRLSGGREGGKFRIRIEFINKIDPELGAVK